MHIVKVASSTAQAPAVTSGGQPSPLSGAAPVPAPLFTAPAAQTLVNTFDKGMEKLLMNSEEIVVNAVGLLFKILNNIMLNPMEEKYRKLKSTGVAFSSKILAIPGGPDCMRACGFVEGNGEWVLVPSAEGWNLLVACRNKLEIFYSKLNKKDDSSNGRSQVAAPAPTTPNSSVNDSNAALLAILSALQSSAQQGGSEPS